MKCSTITAVITILTILVQRCEAQTDESAVRELLRGRFNSNKTVTVHVKGTVQNFNLADHVGATAKSPFEMLAQLDFVHKRFRFNIAMDTGENSLMLLDRSGFQTCEIHAATNPKWQPKLTDGVEMKPPWLHCLPLLLSYGMLLLPPDEVSGFVDATSQSTASTTRKGFSTGLREFQWESSDGDTIVANVNGSGSVRSWRLRTQAGAVVRIQVNHPNRSDTEPPSRFSVEWFSVGGGIEGRIDATVVKAESDMQMPPYVFFPIRSEQDYTELLSKKWDAPVKVDPVMSVEGVLRAVQETMAVSQLHLHVEPQLIEEHGKEVLEFDGATSLSSVLFDKLRSKGLDFRLAPQGLVVQPRRLAWNYANLQDYRGADYQLDFKTLRDTLFSTGSVEEWSAVGGPAHLIEDPESESVMVLHAQSDHIQFKHRLQQLRGVKND